MGLSSLKKFEEGIFSDLRNLKPGIDATLEGPRSEFLEFLYKNGCIRTQKKQKVFFWYSVPHDALFCDALERDLRRESNMYSYQRFVSIPGRNKPDFQRKNEFPDLDYSNFTTNGDNRIDRTNGNFNFLNFNKDTKEGNFNPLNDNSYYTQRKNNRRSSLELSNRSSSLDAINNRSNELNNNINPTNQMKFNFQQDNLQDNLIQDKLLQEKLLQKK